MKNNENEEWRDVDEFPNHQVSSYGRVRNKKNGHVLKTNNDRYGYPRLSIGSIDNVPVHRLVCKTFHGKPTNGKSQVNHIDCNRANNKASNLEWCTASENIKWGVTHGNVDPFIGLARASEVNLKPVKLVESGKTFSSVKECASYLGVKPTNVSRCLTGERKGQRLHGCHIEYLEKVEDVL